MDVRIKYEMIKLMFARGMEWFYKAISNLYSKVSLIRQSSRLTKSGFSSKNILHQRSQSKLKFSGLDSGLVLIADWS